MIDFFVLFILMLESEIVVGKDSKSSCCNLGGNTFNLIGIVVASSPRSVSTILDEISEE